MKRPAVFFDRDNTLIVNDGYLGDPDGVVLVDGAAELIARVRRLGYAAVTFSNQSGVARGLFTEQDVHHVNSRLDEMLRDQDPAAVIDRHEFCPHHPDAAVPRYRQASEFRKPAPGMIYQAARQLGLDLGRSWVVGDAARDIEAGRAAGCRTILFKALSHSRSPAANEPLSIDPDFVAASLRDVADLIENNSLPEEPSEPAPVIEVLAEQITVESGAAVDSTTDAVVSTTVSHAAEPGESDGEHRALANESASTEILVSLERESPEVECGLPAAAIKEPQDPIQVREQRLDEQPSVSQEHEQTSAAVVENSRDDSDQQQEPPPQAADEEDMEDQSANDPAEPSGGESDGASRRRSPPAVILAAKAARAAARNSAPDAPPEVLREVARNAAREAAMGITRDYAAAAPATDADGFSPPSSREVAQEVSVIEPAAEPLQDAEPAPTAKGAVSYETDEGRAAPAVDLNRLEQVAEQILLELRQRNDVADFSVSKLMAGITMVISLALLIYAYLYKNDPTALHSVLLLGLMLQSITISLLIMGRQK